jgi:Domain of unknown function (DUF222)
VVVAQVIADVASPGPAAFFQEAFRGAIEALASESIGQLSDRELGDELVELRRGIDQLEAEFTRRLQTFDERQAYRADGSASAVSWLRSRCGLSGGGAAQRVEIARELDAVPGASELFRQGDIGFHNAAVLSRTVTEVGREAATAAAPTLVDAAVRLDPAQCRTVGKQLRHMVDPEGELAQALRDHRRRRFSISEAFDGMYVCEGLFDVEGGAVLRSALEALSMPRKDDDRSPAQRRADALVELATRQLQGGTLPSSHGQRPHLLLTVSEASLQGRSGEPAGELQHGGMLATAMARRIACDASVSQMVTDGSGNAVAVGNAKRSVPPSMRRALITRDRGCRFPGCDRPSSWCDAHHVIHWIDHGETELYNLVLLCRAHHRFVHEEGWTLTGGDGHVQVRPPPAISA